MRMHHAVARAWPVSPPMCAPPPLMLCVFLPELFSDCRSESVLVLQAASLVLACKCRSLQLPAEAIQPGRDARMHQPSLYSYIPFARFRPTCACACTLHAHRGPWSHSHLGEAAFGSRMCSSQTHVQPSPPRPRAHQALPRIIPPRLYSPRYTPLGALLCLRWAVRPTSRPT